MPADPVEPRPSASVIIIRDAPLEVLMMRRHEKSSFVPNAWVFPGGATDPIDRELAAEQGDGSLLMTMRFTAAREAFEECGVWLGAPFDEMDHQRRRLLSGALDFRSLHALAPLDLERLVWTSRWITPVGIPKRFDTWFFLAAVDRQVVASAEQIEATDVTWISPANALARHAEGSMQMVFPTLRNLEALTPFSSAIELIEARRGAVIEPVLPVLVDGKPTLPARG